MKIAIVCYPTFGGSGVVATELGIALAEKGHEVHFVTYKQPVRLEYLSKNIYFHEVSVPRYPLFQYQPYELALSSKLVETVKQYDIDLMHVHYAIPHAYAGYMAKQMLAAEGIQVPMVTTLHGTDITLVGNHPDYKPAVTFSINSSDAITSVSQSLKEDTLKHFEVKKDIHVIPNFIDLNNHNTIPKNKCKRSVMAESHEKIITHISNLRSVKRLLDIIEVFDRIQKEIPAKLVIVGEGPDKQAAEDLATEKGIASKVLFLGKSSEISEILSVSDLFILPSEKESFGLAALEAMASGVPVISSNAGGIPEVNIHGLSGYLSDVGDVEDMTKNALKILETEESLNTYKENARITAKKFSINKIVPLYEKVYNECLN